MSAHTKSDHSTELKEALEALRKAMTFRWRELLIEAITYPLAESSDDFPEAFERERTTHESMWPYWAEPNTYHLGYSRKGLCAYVAWVDGGQKGDLSSVTCEGLTDADRGEKDDSGTPIPKKIDCGVGAILQQIDGWAGAECDVVYDRLPKFDGHDLDAIENAHDEFLSIGKKLALTSSSGVGGGSMEEASGRDLVETVTELAGGDDARLAWWVGWTGLAASRAKDGFFDSCKPTIHNQSRILAALANLYSARAAIIEETRSNGLAWVQWATKGLGETETSTKDLTPVWKTVQGIGSAVAIGGSWSVAAGAVGTSAVLVGFLGENLIKKVKSDPEYKHELEAVVEKLYKEVDDLNPRVTDLESEYDDAVTELQTTLYGIHSFDLELYDLTENSSDGDRKSDSGYTADIGGILTIAGACFEAGEDYEALLSMIDKTTDVDKHLSDKDGNPTSGDIALLEIRDQLVGFLKTTTGRYYLAFEQVKDSAEAYAAAESEHQQTFKDFMDDWADSGVGEYDDSDIKPEKEAKDTDRGNFNPHEYGGHPLSGSEPGENAEHEYLTEETEPYEVAD